ncbi:hypothetical protein [Tateyamaria sp. SN6-1]|uniref:hypothetical protein n=1 Tax=Tateyamaria sp. SN6-1 TaxID=3092148 RepID=UPI0039F6402B
MPYVTKPGAWPGVSAQNHAKQIYMPQSCVGYSDKMANLERTIASIEDKFNAALDHARYVGRLNKGLLTASLIKDTCVGFLDVGANILKMAGMTKAAEVAEKGVAAIDVAETTSQYAAGQINTGQAMANYSHIAAGQMGDKSMTQAGFKHVAQTHTGAAKVMADSIGQPKSQGQEAGKSYAVDQIKNTADLIAKAATDAKQPWGSKLSGIMSGVKLMAARDKYGKSLEKSFDTYLDEKQRIDQMIRDAEQEFRPQIREMRAEFAKLKASLQSCVNDAQQAAGETPTFEFTPSTSANSTPAFATYAWPGAK